ncbi:MAG: nitrate/nitrite transporter NrtS [Dehalococcoidia bacterium]|nr:nitrate/nitrite transporter NrtS [Dehalococcoidia bacterium]
MAVAAQTTCSRCHATLGGSRYELRAGEERRLHCLRCGFLYPPMVRRSLLIALLVGTVLTAINQGNLLVAGDFPAALYWKIPLTYSVPFCVATTGALLNARVRRSL